MHTEWSGDTPGFEDADWNDTDPVHLIMYLKSHGKGKFSIITLTRPRTLGLTEAVEYYPKIERGSWDVPQYYELLGAELGGD